MQRPNPVLPLIAFAVGVLTFGTVTTFVSESGWKGVHVMFVLLAARLMEGLFGVASVSAHRGFMYALAAVLHGFLVALTFLFVLLFAPRLSRRGAWVTLVILVVVDVALLVLTSPMRELP
jgi:hypothetical protein